MKNILIVDDCKTTRKLLSYLLKEAKLNITLAENGFDALEKLARNAIDIVLTDMNMPQMDGIELIRSMKEDDSYKNIPIVMLTTEADESERNRGLEVGASSYLTKPVGKEQLMAEINKYIG